MTAGRRLGAERARCRRRWRIEGKQIEHGRRRRTRGACVAARGEEDGAELCGVRVSGVGPSGVCERGKQRKSGARHAWDRTESPAVPAAVRRGRMALPGGAGLEGNGGGVDECVGRGREHGRGGGGLGARMGKGGSVIVEDGA